MCFEGKIRQPGSRAYSLDQDDFALLLLDELSPLGRFKQEAGPLFQPCVTDYPIRQWHPKPCNPAGGTPTTVLGRIIHDGSSRHHEVSWQDGHVEAQETTAG